MRDETAAWLEPLQDAAEAKNLDLERYQRLAMMPATEAGRPVLPSGIAQIFGGMPGVQFKAIDWVRFGQLLRHDLGMDDTYPAFPNFPEARTTP